MGISDSILSDPRLSEAADSTHRDPGLTDAADSSHSDSGLSEAADSTHRDPGLVEASDSTHIESGLTEAANSTHLKSDPGLTEAADSSHIDSGLSEAADSILCESGQAEPTDSSWLISMGHLPGSSSTASSEASGRPDGSAEGSTGMARKPRETPASWLLQNPEPVRTDCETTASLRKSQLEKWPWECLICSRDNCDGIECHACDDLEYLEQELPSQQDYDFKEPDTVFGFWWQKHKAICASANKAHRRALRFANLANDYVKKADTAFAAVLAGAEHIANLMASLLIQRTTDMTLDLDFAFRVQKNNCASFLKLFKKANSAQNKAAWAWERANQWERDTQLLYTSSTVHAPGQANQSQT